MFGCRESFLSICLGRSGLALIFERLSALSLTARHVRSGSVSPSVSLRSLRLSEFLRKPRLCGSQSCYEVERSHPSRFEIVVLSSARWLRLVGPRELRSSTMLSAAKMTIRSALLCKSIDHSTRKLCMVKLSLAILAERSIAIR